MGRSSDLSEADTCLQPVALAASRAEVRPAQRTNITRPNNRLAVLLMAAAKIRGKRSLSQLFFFLLPANCATKNSAGRPLGARMLWTERASKLTGRKSFKSSRTSWGPSKRPLSCSGLSFGRADSKPLFCSFQQNQNRQHQKFLLTFNCNT